MEKTDLFAADNMLRDENINLICGVDEAGRGPLAGPVCVATVIFSPDTVIEGINDSKKLTEKKREVLFAEIKDKALAYSICMVDEKTIDEINILNATMKGMKEAVDKLSIKPDLTLVDGNKIPDGMENAKFVISGDAKQACIAAASILAKVTRDRYIVDMAEKYPQYAFEKHKGYGTKLHYEMLEKYGPCEIHRKTFLKKFYEHL